MPGSPDLAARVLAGDRGAIARALSVVERGGEPARTLIGQLFPSTGRAHLVGLTGVGGVGKSSLLARLAAEWRRRGRTVGIVAVDPSSARTGGALLGDRVRMEELLGDPGVFVRSMAARGAVGGLAGTATDAARVLDAAGFDVVALETIGAGQDEVEVARAAETVVLVEAPNLGDDVQALKAGLLEIADVVVVNKADLGGADRTAAFLEAQLRLEASSRDRPPPVLRASAATGDGIPELADTVDAHLAWLAQENRREQRARARAKHELERLLREELLRRVSRLPTIDAAADAVATRRVSPYDELGRLLDP